MAKVKVSAKRKKKKAWYRIIAPREFKNIFIGETTAYESENLIGRTLKIPLSILINDPKRQYIQIKFSVDQVEDGQALTKIVGYNISSSYIKRYVRRNKSKFEESFICDTKDNVKIRIKPYLLVRTKVKGILSSVLRKNLIEFVRNYCNKQTYDELVSLLISYRFQNEVRSSLKKIYPVSSVDIKIMKRLS